ncbi:uncharacterized protein LOC106672675 [Cimex lectularius]|uniref:C2 domain-containing protein n=1 Tax=Cimex lectularius TaxID=79782 RepID=A0A8I6SKV2_CIMLE|nr:uncharacterized protein LOC106672675 [Cimex lectularius]
MALCCTRCFEFCFGWKHPESRAYPKPEALENQAIKTVRRISSVGQTVIDENGEEKEIPRHSNILKSFNDVPVPWTSTTLSIQPEFLHIGVTKEDVMNRIKALPTIVESTPKPKQKGWRKALSKKDSYSPLKAKDKSDSSVRLSLFAPVRNVSKSTEVINSKENLKKEENKAKTLSSLRRGSYGSSPNLSSAEAVSEISTSTSNFTLTSLSSDKFENKLLLPLTKRWQLSQSMEDVNKTETVTPAELAKRYGLDISLYSEPLDYPLLNQKSVEIKNLYIAKSEGVIDMIVSYHDSEQLLTVFINQIKGLSGVGPSREAFSPMLKLTVLGEKKQVKNEKKIAPNLNPNVNQYFTFYVKDKDSKTLRVSIFNSNFSGRNDAIGHGLLNLKGIKDEQSITLKIQRPSYIGNCPAMLSMSFCFEGGVFHLTLNQIFNLASKFKKYKLQSKMSHYSSSKKIKEKVTPLPPIEDESNGIHLNHYMKFKIDSSGLRHDYILISIKTVELAIFKKNEKTIGRFYLGPGFYYKDNTLTPWGRAILHGEKVNYSFKLYL